MFGLLALTRCAPAPPPPPVLTMTIAGGGDQNPDTAGARLAGRGARVYQLSGTAKFEQTDVFALKDNEKKTLGSEAARTRCNT